MPALDFPASPTNGQVFGNWIYSTAKGAWQSKPLTPAKTVNSPTAPTSPADGDQWFNTNTGQLFIYYTDANGSQWVESRAPITADGYVSPNYIINGGFDIWQRGTSGSIGGTVGFSADRWQTVTYAGGTTYWFQQAAGTNPIGARYCLRIQRASGATNTASMNTGYAFETQDVLRMAGKTMTLSFYARAGANYSPVGSALSYAITWGTGTDQSVYGGGTGGALSGGGDIIRSTVTLTTGWQRYTITFAVPATATTLGFAIYSGVTGTAGAADYYDLTGVQLEEGSVATPFRRNANSIAGELAACQRYFYNPLHEISVLYSAFGNAVTYSANAARATIELPVTMRVVPTITGITVGDFWLGYGNIGNNFQATGMTIDPSTRNHLQITVNTSGGMNNNTFCQLYRPNATTVFPINAEL